jgi:diguanylate cyclase (GGDEF)-like protein
LKQKYWNLFLVLTFLIISTAVIGVGSYYKSAQSKAYKYSQYNDISTSLVNKLETLIEEKKNTTLTIGLTLAQNKEFISALKDHKKLHKKLSDFSNQLRQKTDFKNVWIQLINDKDIVLSRSWNDISGDTIEHKHVLEKKDTPYAVIDVDKYDLNFKAIVPIFDSFNKYLGCLEVISHFNSIDTKIKEEGFKSVVVVDKRYKKILKKPFTKLFIDNYYIANKNINQQILKYIGDNGINNFIDYTTNYTLDSNGRYLIVNHTLFDNEKNPMAYILMFKEITTIDTGSIKNLSFIINMFMIFMVVVVGFLLLLLRSKDDTHTDSNVNTLRHLYIFIAAFLGATLIYYLLINTYQKNEKMNYLIAYNKNIEKDYQIINNKFKTVADTMFETIINTPDVLKLVSEAYDDKKDSARKELYLLLKDKYEYFKKYDIRQLHFHLKNNESFLRFHRPNKFGDSLSGVRSTVEWVNANHKRVEGFEEGRIYNGFRYVYPLAYIASANKVEHVGSVEVSFSAHAIAQDFASSHDAKICFLIAKNVVDSKVFSEEHSNYVSSEFNNFYYEKAIREQLEKSFIYYDVSKISSENINKANAKIFNGETFTISSKDGNTLFTFLPLKNPITKKVVATIILEMNNRILEKQNEFFFLLFFTGTVIILLVTIFIFREFTSKIKFLDLSLKAQRVLDTQKSIVIITDGKSIFDVNKKFLEFFDYKTLEDFKVDYDCICDRFIEDDNYYHLGKVPESSTWIEHIQEIPDKDRIVLIKDSNDEEHSFTMSLSQYSNEYFIVTFTDISGTMQEQFMLERKTLHDKLTNAYNREFFDKRIEKIILEHNKNDKNSALILFDIDYFKNVNDTYGHNIGDYVLQELVGRIKDSIRESDYLIRWGGEEFIVLISTKSIDEAKATAEHLRSMIENHYFNDVEKITCSFGVTLHKNNESIMQTVDRADKALYKSKNSGRNKVTIA